MFVSDRGITENVTGIPRALLLHLLTHIHLFICGVCASVGARTTQEGIGGQVPEEGCTFYKTCLNSPLSGLEP